MENQNESTIQKNLYFTVSPVKLIFMSIFSIGLYNIFWFYKNWETISNEKTKRILPFARALFSIIFTYSCYKTIYIKAKESKVNIILNAAILAILYVVISLLFYLPKPYLLLGLLNFLPILVVNGVASNLNKTIDKKYEDNSYFSLYNMLLIIIGCIFLILAIIGLLKR